MRGAVSSVVRALGPAVIAGLVACGGGGGGGGGGGPSGPDVTPPAIPVSTLILVEPPIPATLVRLSGRAGAVEANAVVGLSNTSAAQREGQPVTATALASSQGTFDVSVAAQLGDQLQLTATDAAGNTSGALALRAGPVPTPTTVTQPGGSQLATLVSGEGAFTIPFPTGNERYTLVVQSLNPVNGSFPLTLTGSGETTVRSLTPAAREDAPVDLEAELRASARRAIASLPRSPARGRRLGLSDDPEIGSTRMFNVVNRITIPTLTNRSHFDLVTARLRYKGDHTLIYVETQAEGPNVTDAMIQQVGDRFDDRTYDTNRDAFGPETDIDANGRVIILLTATVNSLNEDDAEGILTGFFYAIDLLFDALFNPFANDAEIFYALVPDPDKQFGGAVVPVEGYADLLDGVLAHEFQHMINAGGRIQSSLTGETVWLDEGLSHYAETLNGIGAAGVPDLQNLLRSALWLDRPHAASLVGADATLAERGAAWLLVAYLVDHYGQGILRDLVEGPLTGIPNVEDKANTSFPFLFFRFTASLLLDGSGLSSDPWFDFPSLDLRAGYEEARSRFLTQGRILGPYLGSRTATLPGALGSAGVTLTGSSSAYFDVGVLTPGTAPFIVRADRQSNLQVTIIRTQ